jgi:hypothetical protein
MAPLMIYGSLDENLYFDRYGDVQIEWEMSKSVIYGTRKEWNYPRFRENFELLATRGENGQKVMLLKLKNDNRIMIVIRKILHILFIRY